MDYRFSYDFMCLFRKSSKIELPTIKLNKYCLTNRQCNICDDIITNYKPNMTYYIKPEDFSIISEWCKSMLFDINLTTFN
jgi:hypothetical protein